jgi:hypothetical protein
MAATNTRNNVTGWHSHLAWVPAAVIFAAAVYARVAALLYAPNFWRDEAMLFDAVNTAQRIAPWIPLPLFDQASPFVPLVVYKILVETVGLNEVVLRLPSFLMGVAALVVVTAIGRQLLSPLGAASALLLAGFCTEAIIQANQFKQYSFEFFVSGVILLTAVRLFGNLQHRSRIWSFAATSIAALPFSFTAPISTAGCGLAVMLIGVSERRWGALWKAREFLFAGTIWFLAAILWQLFAVEPATRINLEGAADAYGRGLLSFSNLDTFANVGRILISTFTIWIAPTSLRRALTAAMLVITVSGILLYGRRDMRVHLPFIATTLVILALNLSGKLPIIHQRQFIFLLPMYALSFGASVQALLEAMNGWFDIEGRYRHVSAVTLTAIGLVLSPFAVAQQAYYRSGEELGTLFSRTPKDACPVMWTYYLTWPTARIYGSRLPNTKFIGQVSIETGLPGWVSRVRDNIDAYRKGAREEIISYDHNCLLFSSGIVGTRLTGTAAEIFNDVEQTLSCKMLTSGEGANLYTCQRS